LKYIASVQAEDITIGIESCWIMGGGGREGIRETNRKGSTDQSKVYLQWEYIEKPLWTSTLELIMKDRTVKYVQYGGYL
jgi:hypothetical protein